MKNKIVITWTSGSDFQKRLMKESITMMIQVWLSTYLNSHKKNRINVELDLEEGKSRCEAIVTTGSGTGVETPIDKLKQYKELLEEFPLIVGAGVDLENVYDQLKIVDGVIIGSYFKLGGDTHRPIERQRVRDLMNLVGVVRGF